MKKTERIKVAGLAAIKECGICLTETLRTRRKIDFIDFAARDLVIKSAVVTEIVEVKLDEDREWYYDVYTLTRQPAAIHTRARCAFARREVDARIAENKKEGAA